MSAGNNTIHAEYTNGPLAAEFVTQIILTHFPDSFARVIDQNVLFVIKIIDDIKTAAVISDLVIAERIILSVLQRHLKFKLNGKQVLKKEKTLTNS